MVRRDHQMAEPIPLDCFGDKTNAILRAPVLRRRDIIFFQFCQEKYFAQAIRESAHLGIVIDAPPRSIRTEMNLVGLLTHASSDQSCLPSAFLHQWLFRFAPPRLQWRGRAGFSPASQTSPGPRCYTPAKKTRQAKIGKLIFFPADLLIILCRAFRRPFGIAPENIRPLFENR